MDNIMLDDFVSELMSLTGPLVGGEGASSLPQTTGNTPSAAANQSSPLNTRPTSRSANDPTRSSSTAATNTHRPDTAAASSSPAPASQARQLGVSDSASSYAAQSKSANGKAATPGRASNRYRKLLDSDAIESLLSKYSPIYERFWHATLMLLSNKKRQAAVDY